MDMQIIFLAWRNLFRNFRRTLASLMTVGLGAAGLLIYQGFNNGIMNQYRANTIRGIYGYGQIFQTGYYGKVHEQPWQQWIDHPTTAAQALKEIPEIEEVYARIGFYSFVVKGSINLAGKGDGVEFQKESTFFNQLNFISGSGLTQAGEIILGKGLAESLNAKVGDTVTVLVQTTNGQLNGQDFTVSGVFHTGLKAYDDVAFRIDLQVAQKLLDTDKVELFSLKTRGVEYWSKIERDLKQKFPQFEGVSFDQLDAIYYKNSVDFLDAQFSFIRMIILFIVGLGIFNTITVGLLERAPEVGALRANGESRRRLFRIFLCENAILGLIGGLIGVTFAVLLNSTLLAKGIPMPPGPGITRKFFVFIEMEWIHVASALALPTLASVAASLLPISNLLKKRIPDLLQGH